MELRTASKTSHEHAGELIDCEVRTRVDDRRIGRVEDILIDESGRIRYLDVTREEDDSHVLLPAGNTRFASEGEVVWIYGMTSSAMGEVPAYDGRPADVDRDYERNLTNSYDRAYADDRYYDRPEYESSAWNRGRTRAAEETPGRREGTLGRLDRLEDYEVADHEHDPRGWDVIGRDGADLGKVDHLIGDTGTMKIRYLVVDLRDDVLENDREILVPAGHVRLEPENRQVRVDALTRENVDAMPAYTGEAIDRDFERKLHGAFARGYEGDRFYQHPRYRDEGLRRRRRTRSGGETAEVRQRT